MFYLAYGSNLSVEQMAHRCPDARPVGIATIKDYCLNFHLHATISPAKGKSVPVVVWEISDADEKSLDRYEGVKGGYYIKAKKDVLMKPLTRDEIDCVTFGECIKVGKRRTTLVSALIYIMTSNCIFKQFHMPPSQEYWETIFYGYQRFGFNPKSLVKLLK